MKLSNRKILYYIVLSISLLFAVSFYFEQRNMGEIPYSEFVEAVKNGEIESVVVQSSGIMGHDFYIVKGKRNDEPFASRIPNDSALFSQMLEQGLDVRIKPASNFLASLTSWLNILFFVILIALITGFLKLPGRGMMQQFGGLRNKMQLASPDQKVTFNDVAGVNESKSELQELVDFLKFPHKYRRLGSRIPRGCLLVGPPGSGKTLLSRAVAGEAKVPFLSISGSDFVEVFVGMGASRVRDLFAEGKKHAPCIIFIDEIDAVGRQRGVGLGGGNDEREQTLNQLLVELDGFQKNDGVIIIAATNRPDVLDQALLRPGRFDRQIFVPLPDIVGREAILHIHTKGVPVSKDVDSKVLARGTPGFSGADLANLVNEAALLAARNDQLKVTMHDFEMAKDKLLLGNERKSLVMTDMDKKLIAYHEAGHALVSVLLPASDPVHKVTIIPRGRALGVMMRLPKHDKISVRKDQLLADIAVALAGREAELLIFGVDKVSTGASSDFRMATDIAKRMVVEWGMSVKFSNIYMADEQQSMFGRNLRVSANVSNKTAEMIDSEIERLIGEGQTTARESLEKYRHVLEAIVQELLVKETLNGYDLAQLIKKHDASLDISKFTESSHQKENKKLSKSADKPTSPEKTPPKKP